jgi:hypothetical protein
MSRKSNSGTRALFLRVLLLVTPLVVVPDAAVSAREHSRVRTAPSVPTIGAQTEGHSSVATVDASVRRLAFSAAHCAVRTGTVTDPSTLTIIDYSQPSTAKRLSVFDLRTRELVYQELVAHGQGSGANFATLFSNEPETHRSSLGLFVTEDTYVGKNGYSLRLNGLEPGVNDRARERAIVMHGAPYVSPEFAQGQGRLGRSWGCPALRDSIAREVIDRIKGGSLVFAYYPDHEWLESSRYLGGCSAAN